ncbi:MAG: flagellar biosynthesis protein FlhB [Thermincola sp.]|jgi:flagellar biosynthetic protein FlhB|nr:flagellar biosynthesis protein FlhB [Thermincola sp.]MDT3701777.1 flagellar biosynthesis protein FlhB [Thermincola sp.]
MDFRQRYITIDLQLFAEKTEKPTPKKRQQAAQKGQIAQSTEINSVVVLLATFMVIKLFTPYMIGVWTSLTSSLFQVFTRENFIIDYHTLQTMFFLVLVAITKILAPIMGGALVSGLAASFLQTGFRINPEAIAFKLENINPISGLKRIFSAQSLAELVKSIIKLIIVGYIVYSEYTKEIMNFTRLSDMSLQASAAFIGNVTLNVVFKVIVWLAILAVADYIFQRLQMEKRLKMSKQEIKDEYKQSEGDPLLKSKIKQKQKQISMARMMQVLPKADVVITNPTHFAVALQYDADTMAAPLIIAKGQDYMAQRIRATAREHNIVVVENKPLAQSLYHSTEIGDAVPPELFQAVAEVLAFVYKLKGKI